MPKIPATEKQHFIVCCHKSTFQKNLFFSLLWFLFEWELSRTA